MLSRCQNGCGGYKITQIRSGILLLQEDSNKKKDKGWSELLLYVKSYNAR